MSALVMALQAAMTRLKKRIDDLEAQNRNDFCECSNEASSALRSIRVLDFVQSSKKCNDWSGRLGRRIFRPSERKYNNGRNRCQSCECKTGVVGMRLIHNFAEHLLHGG